MKKEKPNCFGGNVTMRELIYNCKCNICKYYKECKEKLKQNKIKVT